MGTSKATLDWHGSTLLRRVSGVVHRSVGGPVVVVAAAGQELPALPGAVEVVADSRPGRGPLQGLADGLAAVADRAAVAYVSSVDVPLLHPAFVRAVVASLRARDDAAVPEVRGRLQPLAGAYRVDCLATARELLAGDQLAMMTLLGHCRVRVLREEHLPQADSLQNLNQPEEYARAIALAAPPVNVNGSPAHAWCLGDLLRGRMAVVLNGEPVDPDPELPLAAGDVISIS